MGLRRSSDGHAARLHCNPVRERGAASRPCARIRADRRARRGMPAPAADPCTCSPAPTSTRPRTCAAAAAAAGRSASSSPRTRAGSAAWPTRCTSRTTTSSARAPTRATGPSSRSSGAGPSVAAISTASRYEGWYCAGCEEFRDAPCPEHDAPLERVVEENWFFRLSRYVPAIRDADRRRAAAHRAARAPQRGARLPRGRGARPQRVAAAGAGRRLGHPGARRSRPARLRVVRRARELRQRARLRSVGRGADAPARHRQGHPALPRGDLARDPAVGRRRAARRDPRARLRDRRRSQDRQVARQRGRSRRDWSSATAPTRCAGGWRARCRASARPTSPRSDSSRRPTATSRTGSGTSCSGWSRWPRARRRDGARSRPTTRGRCWLACSQCRREVDAALDVLDLRRATEAILALVGETNRYVERTKPWTLDPADAAARRSPPLVHAADARRRRARPVRPRPRATGLARASTRSQPGEPLVAATRAGRRAALGVRTLWRARARRGGGR